MSTGYEIVRKLGSGGFGEVFLAVETISGRMVALKSLQNLGDKALEKTIHEIKIISQFYHPNIVTYHTAFDDGGILTIVMEYCEKGSLQDLIETEPIDTDLAIQYILSIAKAIKFVHDKNIVHHDIKPSNILVSSNGEVKLADFGVANTSGFTRIYTPPTINDIEEHIKDKRLDIFALGISLIELINGSHPLINLSREQAIQKLKNGDLGIAHHPEWLQEVILKAIQLKEEDRFQHIEEFIEAIETNEIQINIDRNLIAAAGKAHNIAGKLRNKKYDTVRKDIEQLEGTSLLNYSVLLQQTGRYYLAINEIQKAKKAFEHIKDKTPSLDINKELGIVNLELGNTAIAINLFKEHISVCPDDIEAYNLLLEAYFKSKRFKTGNHLCSQLCKVFPDEICFKANAYLFEKLSAMQKENVDETYRNNGNYFVQYNLQIFNSDRVISGNPKKDLLLDKLLFCHFSVTKAKSANMNLEITLNNQLLKPVPGFITIGRIEYGNDIELTGKNVSRRHCLILPYENENWLYDLNSIGTWVDGSPVKGRIRLLHKHVVQIGDHELIVNIDKYKLF